MSESSPGQGNNNQTDAAPSTASRPRNRSGNDRGGNQANRRFQGACEAIKDHVYDVSANRGTGSDLFMRTTRSIAEYVAAEYKDASEFRLALPEMYLAPLTEPVEETNGTDALGNPIPTRRDERVWEMKYSQYVKDVNIREKNMGKVFALILGQCATSFRDKIKAAGDWDNVNNLSDPIALLKLIRSSIYQRGTSRKSTHC